MHRVQQLTAWIEARLNRTGIVLEPASEDASFRRYFRLALEDRTLIAMDAPPAHEDCRPFVQVAGLFKGAGVNVPSVIEQDFEQGFLLLSDLGTTTYLAELNPTNADLLYRDAIDALLRIQSTSKPGELPNYDHAMLRREVMLFPEWYVHRHLGVTLDDAQKNSLETCFERIVKRNLSESHVYVHRDYHSRNLMVSTPNPGILDFQDAVYGPISYDLASLFKDAYIAWEEERLLDWMARYWEKARKASLGVPDDFGEFYKDFEWMAMQRHLKVLGIFARLWHRDGKNGYLKDLPLVMSYLRNACRRYNEVAPLSRLLDELEGAATATGLTF